jgi:predicted amidohydrolase YtcJ
MITHLQLVTPQDILRFSQLGIIALPNPYWFKIDKYYHKLALPYLGEDRARQQYPMRSFLDCGVRLASASDFPVTVPFDPLIGMELGVTRSPMGTVTGDILWPEERLNLAEMVASFTINGAYSNFLEQRTGSLKAGKQADFIVLDRNIFNIPPEAIATAKVLQTYLDGREVFNAEGNA